MREDRIAWSKNKKLMRAIEFDKKLKITENYPVPEPQDGEALIKIITAGICNTDIEIIKGYMGFSGILGHEFVGVVEKINGSNQELLSQRVVGEINCGCGYCEYCLKGLENHCPNRTVLGILNKNGCFADYITLPVKNLHKVPDDVTNQEAVFTEPLAAAFEILEQIQINPDDKVLILGDGKLGLLISFVLNLTQAEVILVGKHQEKLDIAKNQGIKSRFMDDLFVEKNYAVVVEATGNISGFELAQNLVKPKGIIVLKSTLASEKPLNLAPIVIDEIKIIGSRCGPFKPALDALEKKLIDVKPLISKFFEFDKALDAFELSKIKGILKVLINF